MHPAVYESYTALHLDRFTLVHVIAYIWKDCTNAYNVSEKKWCLVLQLFCKKLDRNQSQHIHVHIYDQHIHVHIYDLPV